MTAHADHIHRTAKLFVEQGRTDTVEAAEAILEELDIAPDTIAAWRREGAI